MQGHFFPYISTFQLPTLLFRVEHHEIHLVVVADGGLLAFPQINTPSPFHHLFMLISHTATRGLVPRKVIVAHDIKICFMVSLVLE